jgi:hypothetical protein
MVYDYIQDTLKATLENGCSQRYPHHWISRSSSALAATMPQLDMLCLRFSNPKKTGKHEKLCQKPESLAFLKMSHSSREPWVKTLVPFGCSHQNCLDLWTKYDNS